MEQQKKGFLARYVKVIVILAVVAGSSSGIFGNLIHAPSMAIGFWRLTMGLPFFAVPVLLKQRDVLKKISKKDYLWTFTAGAFLFGHFFTWFNAVKMTNIASAVVLAALPSSGGSFYYRIHPETQGGDKAYYGHCAGPSGRRRYRRT